MTLETLYNNIIKDLDEYRQKYPEKSSQSADFAPTFKTRHSNNITLEDWNNLQQYVSNLNSDSSVQDEYLNKLATSLMNFKDVLEQHYYSKEDTYSRAEVYTKDEAIALGLISITSYDENTGEISILYNADLYDVTYDETTGNLIFAFKDNSSIVEKKFKLLDPEFKSLVHKDGDEEIDGVKTFKKHIYIGSGENATPYVISKRVGKVGIRALKEDGSTFGQFAITDSEDEVFGKGFATMFYYDADADIYRGIRVSANQGVTYYEGDTHYKLATEEYVNSVPRLGVQKVDVLPTEDISTSTIYLLPSEEPEDDNVYIEYMYTNGDWEIIGTTKIDLDNFVDLTSEQTIEAYKNFTQGIGIGGIKILKDSNERIAIYYNNTPKLKVGQTDTLFANRVTPDASNTYDLGRTGVYWKDLYLSGVLTDGTNSISVANITNKNNVYTKTQTTDIINNASGVSKFAWEILSTDTREGISLEFNKEYKLQLPNQTESDITSFSLTIPISHYYNTDISGYPTPPYTSGTLTIPLEFDVFTRQCTFKIYNTHIETAFKTGATGGDKIVFTYEMNGVRKEAQFNNYSYGIGDWYITETYPNGYGNPVFQQLFVGGGRLEHTLYVANENPLSLAFKENQNVITLNAAGSTTGQTRTTISETGLYEFISNAYYGIAVLAYIDVHETHNNGLAGSSYKEVLIPVVIPSSDSIEITGYSLVTIKPLSEGLEGNGIVRVENLSPHVVHFRRIL